MHVDGVGNTNIIDPFESVSASSGASSKAIDTITQTEPSITSINSEQTPKPQDNNPAGSVNQIKKANFGPGVFNGKTQGNIMRNALEMLSNDNAVDKEPTYVGGEKHSEQLSNVLSKTTQTAEKTASNGLATKENINQFQEVMNSAKISEQKDSVKMEGHPHLDETTNEIINKCNNKQKTINVEHNKEYYKRLQDKGLVDENGNVDYEKLGISKRTIRKAKIKCVMFVNSEGAFDFNTKGTCGKEAQKFMEVLKGALEEAKGNGEDCLEIEINIDPELVGPLSPEELAALGNGGQIQYLASGDGQYVKLILDPGSNGQNDGLTIGSYKSKSVQGEGKYTVHVKIPLKVVFEGADFNGKPGVKPGGEPILPKWNEQKLFEEAVVQEKYEMHLFHGDRLMETNAMKANQAGNTLWRAVFEYLGVNTASNVGDADKDNINSNAENLEKTIEEKTQLNSNPQDFSSKWVSGTIDKSRERKYNFLASARQPQGSGKITAEGGIPTFSNVDESNLKQASVTNGLPENHKVDINTTLREKPVGRSLLSGLNESIGDININELSAEVNAEVEAIPTQKAQVAKDSGLNSAEVQQTTEQKAISSEKYKLPENSYVDILQKSSLNSKTAGQNPVDTASSQSSTISTAKVLVTKAKDKRLLLDAIGKLNDEVKRLSDLLNGYDMNTGNINESNSAFNLTLDKINDTLDTIEESTNDENVKRNIGEIKAVVSRGKKPDNRKALLDAARDLAKRMNGLLELLPQNETGKETGETTDKMSNVNMLSGVGNNLVDVTSTTKNVPDNAAVSAANNSNVRSQPQESPGQKLIEGSEFQKNKMFHEEKTKLDSNWVFKGDPVFKKVGDFIEAVEDFEKTSESKTTNNYWDNFEKWYAEKNGGSPVKK